MALGDYKLPVNPSSPIKIKKDTENSQSPQKRESKPINRASLKYD